MIEVYKILIDVERDQLLTVSSNASTRVHQVKLLGGKFETRERTWLFLLQIASIQGGLEKLMRKRNAPRVIKCIKTISRSLV